MTATRDRATVPTMLALGGLSAFGPLATDIYLPALPEIERALATSETAVQLTLSVCQIGLALGQVLVGPLTDRVGRRLPLIIGVALFALTAGLCALAPSIGVLLFLRFLCGVAGGAGIVIARAMVRDLYEGAAAARMYAMVTVVMSLAPIIGPVLGGQLLLVTDWRGVFGALGGIGLVLLAAALTRPETLPADRRRADGLRAQVEGLRAVVREPSFLGPALVQGLGMAAMFVYISMGSFVLQGDGVDPALDAQAYAWVFAVNAAGIVVTSRVSASLAGRLGARRLLGVGVGVAILAAIALVIGSVSTDSVWALLAPLCVLVSCTGLIAPNATALAMSGQAQRAGSASAMIGLLQFLLAAAIPPLASLGGVTPVVMAVTMLVTTLAAGLTYVVTLRLRVMSAT